MKRLLATIVVSLALCVPGFAQQADDTPATKEDVQRYFDVMHSRDMINKMMDAMLKPMHKMMHDQYVKDKDKLPADFEERMNRQMDDMIRDMPWDEMIQAEMPAFQKHLTKGDMNAIVAFYSSPAGKKLLQEMPEIMAEAMDSMMPILRRHLDRMQEKMQVQTAEMLKEAEQKGN